MWIKCLAQGHKTLMQQRINRWSLYAETDFLLSRPTCPLVMVPTSDPHDQHAPLVMVPTSDPHDQHAQLVVVVIIFLDYELIMLSSSLNAFS